MSFNKILLSIIIIFSGCAQKDNPISPTNINNNGRLLSSVKLNGKTYQRLYYGTTFLLDSINYYDSTGMIVEHHEYHYVNAKPVLSYKRSYDKNYDGTIGSYLQRYETQFNDKGLAVKKIQYRDSSNVVSKYWVYEYNSDNLIKSILYYSSQNYLLTKTVYQYLNGNAETAYFYNL